MKVMTLVHFQGSIHHLFLPPTHLLFLCFLFHNDVNIFVVVQTNSWEEVNFYLIFKTNQLTKFFQISQLGNPFLQLDMHLSQYWSPCCHTRACIQSWAAVSQWFHSLPSYVSVFHFQPLAFMQATPLSLTWTTLQNLAQIIPTGSPP